MLLCCITLSSSRENQRSAQEVARRISGAVAGEIRAKSSQDLISRQRAISGAVAGESTQKSTYQVPITYPYLPHYIIFHLPLFFLSPTSPLPFYLPSLSILPLFLYLPLLPVSCLLVCWIACLSRWLKITLNCVTLLTPTTMILLALRLLLLSMLNLVKLMLPC